MPLLRITIAGKTQLCEEYPRERASELAHGIMQAWPELSQFGRVVFTAEDQNVVHLLGWDGKCSIQT